MGKTSKQSQSGCKDTWEGVGRKGSWKITCREENPPQNAPRVEEKELTVRLLPGTRWKPSVPTVPSDIRDAAYEERAKRRRIPGMGY